MTTVVSHQLTTGKTKSCGCLATEARKTRCSHPKHGGTGTRLHNTWLSMRKRCQNKEDKRYGGRGIKVCPGWEKDFAAFRSWALTNGYAENLSIDRIDNDGDYCPENCRWATNKEQSRNTSTTVFVEIEGETKSIVEWAETYGLNPVTVYARRRRGLTGSELIQPPDKKHMNIDPERRKEIGRIAAAARWGKP